MRITQTTDRASEVKKVQINQISNKQQTDRFTHIILYDCYCAATSKMNTDYSRFSSYGFLEMFFCFFSGGRDRLYIPFLNIASSLDRMLDSPSPSWETNHATNLKDNGAKETIFANI